MEEKSLSTSSENSSASSDLITVEFEINLRKSQIWNWGRKRENYKLITKVAHNRETYKKPTCTGAMQKKLLTKNSSTLSLTFNASYLETLLTAITVQNSQIFRPAAPRIIPARYQAKLCLSF
ncbi:hypothetical protein YC2023_060144 [Brassica napus]